METAATEDGASGQASVQSHARIYWDKKEYLWVLADQDMTVSYGLDGGDCLHVYVERKDLRRYIYHYFVLLGELECTMQPSDLSDREAKVILDKCMAEQKVYVLTDLVKEDPTQWRLVAWQGDSREYDPENEVLSIVLHPVAK